MATSAPPRCAATKHFVELCTSREHCIVLGVMGGSSPAAWRLTTCTTVRLLNFCGCSDCVIANRQDDCLTTVPVPQVMLRPAAEGTGVIAGGAVRVVLELAGVKNAFGKQLGSDSPLNNARATLTAISGMRTFKEVSADRGISVQELMGLNQEKKGAPQASVFAGKCVSELIRVHVKARRSLWPVLPLMSSSHCLTVGLVLTGCACVCSRARHCIGLPHGQEGGQSWSWVAAEARLWSSYIAWPSV